MHDNVLYVRNEKGWLVKTKEKLLKGNSQDTTYSLDIILTAVLKALASKIGLGAYCYPHTASYTASSVIHIIIGQPYIFSD